MSSQMLHFSWMVIDHISFYYILTHRFILWQPDPLNGGLEAIVGDQANFDSRLEAAQPDEEVRNFIGSIILIF